MSAPRHIEHVCELMRRFTYRAAGGYWRVYDRKSDSYLPTLHLTECRAARAAQQHTAMEIVAFVEGRQHEAAE